MDNWLTISVTDWQHLGQFTAKMAVFPGKVPTLPIRITYPTSGLLNFLNYRDLTAAADALCAIDESAVTWLDKRRRYARQGEN
ncbi:hypothetical protein ACFSFZ_00530 [Mixta tenebrionis]|uniref:hypothetical protein n=1 Tax=Mixta tenebrionis TaxID=2562439 RepID=UPI00142EE3B6|nr:hypothetical protein [Mixta tenebrionis]